MPLGGSFARPRKEGSSIPPANNVGRAGRADCISIERSVSVFLRPPFKFDVHEQTFNGFLVFTVSRYCNHTVGKRSITLLIAVTLHQFFQVLAMGSSYGSHSFSRFLPCKLRSEGGMPRKDRLHKSSGHFWNELIQPPAPNFLRQVPVPLLGASDPTPCSLLVFH